MADERRAGGRRAGRGRRRNEPKPWFSLWVDDFLGSETVTVCSNRALGCYIKLLCYQWKHRSLPNDVTKLAAIVRESARQFAGLWPEIRDKFPERDGRLVNQRLQDERRHANTLSRVRSQSGSKGQAKRRQLPGTVTVTVTDTTKDKSSTPNGDALYDGDRDGPGMAGLIEEVWGKGRGKR